MSAPNIGVVVAHDDARTIELVAESIESAPDLYVAATSTDAVAHAGYVVVAGGESLVTLRACGAPLVALATDIRTARAALRARARDLIYWPDDEDRLHGAIRRAAAERERASSSGRVVAVVGARGGVGTSVVADLLAVALGDAILLDLDAPARGRRAFAPDEAPARTMASLRASLADLSADVLDATFARGPGAARTLYADASAGPLTPPQAHGLLRASRELGGVTVVDAARCADAGARAAAATADVRLVVVANDVASVRGARALFEFLPPPHAWLLVRARRDGVPARDIAAALGSEPRATIRRDRVLARAADLGELPARPTRAMRALAAVASELREELR
jgi:Flp pilus assembly CpaE family ATPase